MAVRFTIIGEGESERADGTKFSTVRIRVDSHDGAFLLNLSVPRSADLTVVAEEARKRLLRLFEDGAVELQMRPLTWEN